MLALCIVMGVGVIIPKRKEKIIIEVKTKNKELIAKFWQYNFYTVAQDSLTLI